MQAIFTQEFPSLDLDKDFILDNIKPDLDYDQYFLYMNSAYVRPFISEGNFPASLTKAKDDLQYWASLFYLRRSVYWAVREKESQNLVGTVGFNNISFIHAKGEISYDLSYDYWGRGIMNKAIKAITAFGQNQMHLARIQAYTAKNNKRSMKLLERCGFKAEGILRKFEVMGGHSLDYVMYSIVK